jgi:NADH dehydrogenase
MKTAITGATGFIGKYMVRGVLAAGHDVRVLSRPGREDALDLPDDSPVEVFVGDLTDAQSMHGFLEGCDYCIHLASAHDHFTQQHMQAVNVKGTEHLLADAQEHARPGFQFVIISSAVIGVPVYSYYRDSKRVQEKIIRGSGIPWVSFRPTLVYGEGDFRHTAPLLRKCGAEKGTYWVFHEGLSKINPVHVDDLIDAVVRFFGYERGREDYRVFEIAGPEGIAFNDFVDTTIAATGGGVKRRNIPRRWVERAIFLKGLFKDVTKERRGAGYFSLHHEHDIRAAVEELDWRPRNFAEGIRQVAARDWWRQAESGASEAARLGTGGV